MEVSFANARVRRLCLSYAELSDLLGPEVARSAIAQLASLRAAGSLEEFRFLPGRCGQRSREFRLELASGAYIDFEPSDGQVARRAPAWSSIRSIRILRVAEG